MKKIITLFILGINCFFFYQTARGQEQEDKLTLNDAVYARKFYPKSVYGLRSLNDGQHSCLTEGDSLNVYHYKSGKYSRTILTSGELIPAGDTVPIRLSGYTFSQDESKILIPTETESIYRHSTRSFYYV